MIYAKKKIQQTTHTASQTAKIIANVKALEEKNLLRIEGNDVFVYPEIWKDKATALNWIKCLHVYCIVKKRLGKNESLYFKHFLNGQALGSYQQNKATVLIFRTSV